DRHLVGAGAAAPYSAGRVAAAGGGQSRDSGRGHGSTRGGREPDGGLDRARPVAQVLERCGRALSAAAAARVVDHRRPGACHGCAGAVVLARVFLQPLKRVAAATHRLAAGSYDTRVAVGSRDELGRLAEDFNRLAESLERNETLRRRFMADVSHELRTPLTVLSGELE